MEKNIPGGGNKTAIAKALRQMGYGAVETTRRPECNGKKERGTTQGREVSGDPGI